jgi:hypothetical protein
VLKLTISTRRISATAKCLSLRVVEEEEFLFSEDAILVKKSSVPVTSVECGDALATSLLISGDGVSFSRVK